MAGRGRRCRACTFRVPDRAAGCRRSRGTRRVQIGGERRVVGYTEASRGCKHRCRHCPIVPVYDGRFRIVPIRHRARGHPRGRWPPGRGTSPSAIRTSSTARGTRASWSTALAREFPGMTYDVTIKIEHLRRARRRCCRCCATPAACSSPPRSNRSTIGCWRSSRRDTRAADFERVGRALPRRGPDARADVRRLHAVDDARRVLRAAAGDRALDLVEHVAAGAAGDPAADSRGLAPARARRRPRDRSSRYSPASLTYPWRHAIPDVDALQRAVEAMVGRRLIADRAASCSRRSGTTRMRLPGAPPARAARRRRSRARGDPVPERALVLLSGADVRAGGSDLMQPRTSSARGACLGFSFSRPRPATSCDAFGDAAVGARRRADVRDRSLPHARRSVAGRGDCGPVLTTRTRRVDAIVAAARGSAGRRRDRGRRSAGRARGARRGGAGPAVAIRRTRRGRARTSG